MGNTDRIDHLFAQAKANGKKLFVGYICACDPDFNTSLKACKVLVENGVDLLELGVPFSDPLADGLTNQLAAQRALEAGCTQDMVFELVRGIRKFSDVPIVFYTYYNLIFSQGIDAYVEKSKSAGVDGLLTLDLPPEEAGELLQSCAEHDLKNIFILAPTTPEHRIPLVAKHASGFLYYVSREGVTGVRGDLASDLKEKVSLIREHTDLPVVVGFGISSPAQVSEVAEVADGVVVGSALVNCISENLGDAPAILNSLKDRVRNLASGLAPTKVS